MNLTILCHEDWARTRREETTQFSTGSYMSYEDVRRFLAPEALYQPVTRSPVPVLIISDQANPQNPPENVAAAKEHYPNSLALVAPAQGHGYTGFTCRDQNLAAFIEKGTTQGLNADCLQQEPLPPFNQGAYANCNGNQDCDAGMRSAKTTMEGVAIQILTASAGYRLQADPGRFGLCATRLAC